MTADSADFAGARVQVRAELLNGGLCSAGTVTLTISSAQPADEGDYRVEVRDPGGAVVSPSARLAVVPPTAQYLKRTFTNAARARIPFVIHVPANYDPAQRYPLVCFVSGNGDPTGSRPGLPWPVRRVRTGAATVAASTVGVGGEDPGGSEDREEAAGRLLRSRRVALHSSPHPPSGHPLPIGWGEERGEGHL